MIDLQMHSTFSDGSMTPAELVETAKSLGLTAIALTDHDTIDGLPEFLSTAAENNISAVPGVEISVDTKMPNHGHMHMLGLFIDPENEELKSRLNFLLMQRNLRAIKIIQKLNDLGVDVTMEELRAEAGEGAIGRPHVAKIMLRKGLVDNIGDAFEKYLKKGGPAYVDKVKFGEEDALRLIKQAGGLAVLAHPHLMNYDTFEETREKIMSLRGMGLDGFEVFYSGMPENFSRNLQELARQENFVISGGSDFHGANKDDIKMGSGKNDLAIPDSVYHNLKDFWQNGRNG
ncbi:MAG: PHP domain-containing protein [Calditrichia bacterium]